MTRVLMINDKFPPFAISGSARPFYFAKHLAELGFDVSVLAASPPAGETRDDALLAQLPRSVDVLRTPLLMKPTFSRVAQVVGRLRGSTGDRGPSSPASSTPQKRPPPAVLRSGRWWLHWHADWGVLATLAEWRRSRKAIPDVIWVSGPHFRNYCVGYHLAKQLHRPLVVDVRDPWTYGSLWHPETPWVERQHLEWAAKVFDAASRVVFTSPLTMREMARRFEGLATRAVTITNGCDDDAKVEARRTAPTDRCLFLYTGVLNDRRKPDVLLEALRLNNADPAFAASSLLQFVGRSGGHETKVAQFGLDAQVQFVPPVPRAESLQLMRGADANVLLQTISEGHDVIAGKVFEYLSARRPILAVVDDAGGDAWLLRQLGAGTVASWREPRAVAERMRQLWELWRGGKLNEMAVDTTDYQWPSLAKRLGELLTDVAQGR